MGIFNFFKRKTIKREQPTSLKSPATWFSNMFGGSTEANVNITTDVALTYSAVWRCISIISETLAALPLNLFSEISGTKKVDSSDPIQFLIKREPNDFMTSYIYRQKILFDLVTNGNHYSFIVRDANYKIIKLLPCRYPNLMSVMFQNDMLYYSYSGSEYFPATDFIHVKNLSKDGLIGLSPIAAAREQIALGLSQQKFGSKFYANGGHPAGYLKYPGQLGEVARKRLESTINLEYAGMSSTNGILVFEEGLEFVPISIPPEDAQYLESRKFQLSDIARIYGIPLHLLSDLDRATFSNIEQQGQELITYTFLKYLVNIEQELDKKLIKENDKPVKYFKHNLNSLLRGDNTSRAAFYRELFYLSAITPNEIREYEDMNKYDGGDDFYTQVNLIKVKDSQKADNTQTNISKQETISQDDLIRKIKLNDQKINN